jgi:phytoene desaturase
MNAAVIGSGFSGLSAAAYLGANGVSVDVYEKNEDFGGRARTLRTDNGYTFDMGPSWYWMPEVFEKFFNYFGYSHKDFYELKLLDPSFSIIFEDNEVMDVPSDFEELCNMFEKFEKGSSVNLNKFLGEAEYKYNAGINNLVYKSGRSILEFADYKTITGIFRLDIFSSFSKHVKKYFKNPKLISLIEFPVLFLGAMPEKTPALYSLMSYAGLKLGTWYPMGGFGKVIDAMKKVGEKYSVQYHNSTPVTGLNVKTNIISSISSGKRRYPTDAVIASADYNHVEQTLLKPEYRNYSEAYWNNRTFAPSCLIYYVGVSKKLNKLRHHNLFFDKDLRPHALNIYSDPRWPENPLFYVCCPSKTDPSVSPEGHENLFLLLPIAPGLEDGENIREEYFKIMISRINKFSGEDIEAFIDYKKSYCVSDFVSDYNAYKGNAYGLANTLRQTAILKPKLRNKKVNNLFFSGQLTVPGPGVPPSIISGKVAAGELLKNFKIQMQ